MRNKIIGNKLKGYTLIELMIITGVLGLATIGIYTVAMVASDWRKSSQEVKSLNTTLAQIDNSTLTTGSYSGITLSSLNNYSTGFNSALPLKEVIAPNAKQLNFVYDGVSSRICNDFAGKMLQSSKNIGAIINGKQITTNNLGDVASACDSTGGSNAVTIVLNKTQDDFTINNVVASINPPPAPPPDITIPSMPVPQTPPTINAYTPSGLNPGTYPLVTGGPPTYTPGPGGGGQIVVTSPPGSINPVVPGVPGWTPPPVVRPPGTPAPPDQLDQDPNPPPPPPAPTSFVKNIFICQSGYMWEHTQNSANHCGSQSNVIGTVSLNLDTPTSTSGRVTFNLMGFQSCNWGEPVDGPIYSSFDPSWGWMQVRVDLQKGIMRKDVFDNVIGYQFSCGQTG